MKLICAPMATLSHPGFRYTIEKFGGCDEYYTEMINAPSLLNKGQFEKYYINPAPVPEKIVWQLTGKEENSLAMAAKQVCEIGGIGVDLNMGCCAPEIYKSGAGIAWMLKPVCETESMVLKVASVLREYEKETGVHRRLSVKCRLGDEDFAENSFFRFTDMLVNCGVEQIALHPRTKKEKYREKPRWAYAQNLALRYKNKADVIVNGDVCDMESFKKVVKLCKDCSGVMVGRAAVTKPWIFMLLKRAMDNDFSENKDLQVDLLQLGLDFIDAVEKFQPPEFYKTRLNRFFTYFCDNLSFAHYAKTALLNSKSPQENRDALKQYFEKVPQDRIKFV